MPTPTTDFQVGVDTVWLQVQQNFSATLRVYVSSVRGFSTPVTLSASVIPVTPAVDPTLDPSQTTTAPWAGTITFAANPLTPPDYTTVTVAPGTTGGTIDPNAPPTYQVVITGDDGSGNQSIATFTVVVQASIADYGLGITFNVNGLSTVDNDPQLEGTGVLANTFQEKVFFVPNDGGVTKTNDTYWVFYATSSASYPTGGGVIPNSGTGEGFYFKTSIDGATWSKPFKIWTAFPFSAQGHNLSAWYDYASDRFYVAGADPLVGVAVIMGQPRQDTGGNYIISFDGTNNPQSSQAATGPTFTRINMTTPFIHGRTAGSEVILLVQTEDIGGNHYLETWLSTDGALAVWNNIEPVGGLHPFAVNLSDYGRAEEIVSGGQRYLVEIYGGDFQFITFKWQNITGGPPTNAWQTFLGHTLLHYNFTVGKTVARIDTINCVFIYPGLNEDFFTITFTALNTPALGTDTFITTPYSQAAIGYDTGVNPTATLTLFSADTNRVDVSESTDSGSTWAAFTTLYQDSNHITVPTLNSFLNEEGTMIGHQFPVAWSELTTPGYEQIKFRLVEMSAFPDIYPRGSLNVISGALGATLAPIPLFFYPTGDSVDGHTFPTSVTELAYRPDSPNQPFDPGNGGSFVIEDDQGNLWPAPYPPSGFTRESLSRPSYIYMTIATGPPTLSGTRWVIDIIGEGTAPPHVMGFGRIMLQIT